MSVGARCGCRVCVTDKGGAWSRIPRSRLNHLHRSLRKYAASSMHTANASCVVCFNVPQITPHHPLTHTPPHASYRSIL